MASLSLSNHCKNEDQKTETNRECWANIINEIDSLTRENAGCVEITEQSNHISQIIFMV